MNVFVTARPEGRASMPGPDALALHCCIGIVRSTFAVFRTDALARPVTGVQHG